MTKAEIVQALYARNTGFSKKEVADLVDQLFELMKETLGRGEKIKVSGFGNFVLRDKRQRPGRNPQTGTVIRISERRVLNFKASQVLKQLLNTQSAGAGSAASDGRPTRDPRESFTGPSRIGKTLAVSPSATSSANSEASGLPSPFGSPRGSSTTPKG